MYINDTSASGTLPTNATYWEVMLDPTDVNSATDAANEAASDAIDSTRFQHIKYSDYAEPTDGQMNDTNGVYIGLAITSSETAPTTAISYTWNRFKGDTITPKGIYNSETQYEKLDLVTNGAASYLYINDIPSTGTALNNTEYWMCLMTAVGDLADKWASADITATGLAEGEDPTAAVTQDADGTHFALGIPKGDTGKTGVYSGETEPTDPDVSVWVDLSSPDYGVPEDGEDGMSAYEAAQLGGYLGDEATFYTDLAAVEGLLAELEAL